MLVYQSVIGGGSAVAQNRVTIYEETFGTPSSNTEISKFTGWSSSFITPESSSWKVGPKSVCTFDESSKGGNAFCGALTGDLFFNFKNKLCNYTSLELSLFYLKGAAKDKVNSLKLYISKDGGTTWSDNILPENKDGKSSTWYSFTYTIPNDYKDNLVLKFSQAANNTNRIDDLKITGIAVTSLSFSAQAADGTYYATFSSDKDVVFTDDVIVYSTSVSDGKLNMTKLNYDVYEVTDAAVSSSADGAVAGYYVPKNTGVLIESREKETTYYYPKVEKSVTVSDNMLVAANANDIFTAEAGHKYYKLAYKDYTQKTGLGFYWGAEDGGAFKVKKGLAYLDVPPTVVAPAPAYIIGNGGTTAVSGVNAETGQSNGTIYNIAGQRVVKADKPGVYVINGKKIIVRK